MAGGNIKGITIEFRGETTKLDAALKEVNKNTRSLDKELRAVNKDLKFNPTSVDLWRMKQNILKDKIKETSDKLDLLKRGQAEMDAKGVDKNSQEYRELQREILETESKLKTFKGQLKEVGNVKLKALSESLKSAGQSITEAGEKLQGLSTAGAAAATAIGALAVKSGAWADDLNTLSTIYGISTTELQKYSAAANLVDVDVETIAASHVKLTKSMNSALDGTGAQAEAFKKLGVETKNADGSLRSSDEVWNDVIKSLGSVSNETERDALAMTLLGKSAMELNPLIEDGGETYKKMAETMKKYGLDFIDEDTLAKANEFNDELDIMKAVGLTALQSVGASLAGYLAPALAKVVDAVGKLAGWLAQLDPKVLTLIAGIGAVVAVIAPLLIIIGQVATGVGAIVGVIGVIGPAIAGVVTAIGGIVVALGPVIIIIVALIAALVLMVKHWDQIKAKAKEIWDSVTAAFQAGKEKVASVIEGVKTAIKEKFEAAKTLVGNVANAIKNFLSFQGLVATVSGAFNKVKETIKKILDKAAQTVKRVIDKIKGFFKFKWSFPKLKLPHFKVTGKFSLKPPSVPKFSLSWYKNGGIFDQPTIAGIGEAGPEAVVPLDKLWNKLDRIADASAMAPAPTINVYAQPGQDAKTIAREVEKVLVRMSKQRGTAWGY